MTSTPGALTDEDRALRVVERAARGVLMAIPVDALGLSTAVEDDQTPPETACLLYATRTTLDLGEHTRLGLAYTVLTAAALLGQQMLYRVPLEHYIRNGADRMYDESRHNEPWLPVVVRSGDHVVVANGNHRYAADLLIGRPAPVFIVTEPPACACPMWHQPGTPRTPRA